MEFIIYIIACFLQPICWPLPEMTTIFYGAKLFGDLNAFIIGYIAILFGIIFMYKISFYLSEHYLKKIKSGKKFQKFQNYIEKNEILTCGILFILPILPDEIICIGSAIIGIKFKIFIIIAIIAKFISIGGVAFSGTIADKFNVTSINVVLIELLIIFIASLLYRVYKERKNNIN